MKTTPFLKNGNKDNKQVAYGAGRTDEMERKHMTFQGLLGLGCASAQLCMALTEMVPSVPSPRMVCVSLGETWEMRERA